MASFKKLRNGSWGISGPSSEIREDAVVTVTKRDGSTKTVTVTKVLWTGDGKSIAAISNGSGSSGYVRAVRNAHGYVTERGHYEGYCGYDCPVSGLKCCPDNGPCHDCQ